MSFYKVNFNQPNEWVGLDNFTRAFADAELHAAVVNTLLYVVVTMFAAAILAFFLAMLLEGPARHLRFIRTAIFLPAVTSAAIVAEMWRILFNPTPNGVVNPHPQLVWRRPIRAFLPVPIRRWASSCCCISGKRCPTTW